MSCHSREVPLLDGRTLTVVLECPNWLSLSVGPTGAPGADGLDLPPEALPNLVAALLAVVIQARAAGDPVETLEPMPSLVDLLRWALDQAVAAAEDTSAEEVAHV